MNTFESIHKLPHHLLKLIFEFVYYKCDTDLDTEDSRETTSSLSPQSNAGESEETNSNRGEEETDENTEHEEEEEKEKDKTGSNIEDEETKEKTEHEEEGEEEEDNASSVADNEYEGDRKSWRSVNLTCRSWNKICVEILPQINLEQAFKTVLNSSFCCNGHLPSSTQILLRYDKGKLMFPSGEDQNLDDLMSICKEASFGRGEKEVIDPSYRSALVLDPTLFSSNFHPADFNILNDIHMLLSPHSYQVSCQLYSLNVYPPGGFFKVHKDTPLGVYHLGSLVIVLPYPHQGGKLVIKQGLKEESLDSSCTNSQIPEIKWVAFYGNCEHWIEPVTSGFRVTLTYHLFTSISPSSTFSLVNKPIYKMLKSMVAQKQLTRGRKYGFFLQNEYSNEELVQAVDNPMSVLRGGDAMLYAAASNLGLKAKFRAIFRDTTGWYRQSQFRERDFMLISKIIPTVGARLSDNWSEHYESYMYSNFEAEPLDNSIHWCSPVPPTLRNLAGSSLYSNGNTPSTHGYYYQALILLSVPKSVTAS